MSKKVREVGIADEYVIRVCDKISVHPALVALEWRKDPPSAQRCSKECLLSNTQTVLGSFCPADFSIIIGNSRWDALPDLPWIRGVSGSSRRHQDFPGEDHRPSDQPGTQVRPHLIIRHSFGHPAHTRRVDLPAQWVGYLAFQNLVFDLGLSINSCFVFVFVL